MVLRFIYSVLLSDISQELLSNKIISELKSYNANNITINSFKISFENYQLKLAIPGSLMTIVDKGFFIFKKHQNSLKLCYQMDARFIIDIMFIIVFLSLGFIFDPFFIIVSLFFLLQMFVKIGIVRSSNKAFIEKIKSLNESNKFTKYEYKLKIILIKTNNDNDL